MKAQVDAPLPVHDDKTNAVLLFSETIVTLQPNGVIKQLSRKAYKILRPAGEALGMVSRPFDEQSPITFLRAWCIPTTGKDYEVKEKEAVESAVIGVQNSDLINSLRAKLMRIPAATPGSIIGYEVEQTLRPYMRVDEWQFQDSIPVREARYSLILPAGWTYKATWLNYPEQPPLSSAPNQFQWTLKDIKPIRIESSMPPWHGVAGGMVVALLPPDGQASSMQSWRDIGLWYLNLTQGRRDLSPEIKQKVAELTASASTPLQKIQALADFAQNNIRYVAIELGIGGYQPHRAIDTFSNRFGDCKDKVTLFSAMLKEIGIESYYVIINTERGSIMPVTPPNLGFNHVVAAITLPASVEDVSLLAWTTHPKLGRILYFDPTDTLTPLGRLAGGLQSNYGILVTPDGGELVPLPKQPTTSNSIDRTAQMTLDETGMLHGDVREVWLGDPASAQRFALRSAKIDTDRIKPVEQTVAASLMSFEIRKATISNLSAADQPIVWNYTLDAPKYAKVAGDLLLVRPRVLGSKSSSLLETREPREHPIEFDRPQRDKDVFEIEIPKGYEVEELPPPLAVDEGFISYQSKTEVIGVKLRYTRTLEVKELSVPVAKADKLKLFYRLIEDDERRLAVLKRRAK